jgi:large repetitive protein
MPHVTAPRATTRLAVALVAASAAVVPFVGSSPAGARSVPQVACVVAVADDAYSTPINTPLVVADPGVVSNDTLCGTDGLVISTSSPSHGGLSGFDDAGGGFTYTPDPGFTGTDSFTYVLEDVEGSPTGTVTITVNPLATTTSSTTTTAAAPTTTVAVAPAAVTATPAFTG